MRIFRKKFNKVFLAISLCLLLLIGIIIVNVESAGGARIYDTASSASPAPIAIVFGAGYNGKVLSPVLEDRVKTGVELYKLGKVKKLLMTGDNGRTSYNEPNAMKDYAVRNGVPAGDIVCDYAGFRTYDSLYRARDVFGVTSAILVTQKYHLPRALYTARQLGMDVSGVIADKRGYKDQWIYNQREVLSIITAWIDTNITRHPPKYLGPKVTIVSTLGFSL